MQPNVFKEETQIDMVEILYCEKNEKKSRNFLKKFYNFTGDNFRLLITRKIKKIKTLLKNKTFTLHLKYTVVYMTMVKIIPMKPNETLN